MLFVIKRDGRKVPFDLQKIISAIKKAYESVQADFDSEDEKFYAQQFDYTLKYKDADDTISIDNIQELVTFVMMRRCPDAAKSYIIYDFQHKESRENISRINYIKRYSFSKSNAADNSNTDANANSASKNVASLESEVYKNTNRQIQRSIMKAELNKLYPDSNLAKQYIKDLESHIIYTHDEGSSPVPKAYCGAYSTYPMLIEGVGPLDGVTPTAPNDIQSFSGQITNATFALSAQTKGAVALGDFFLSLNYCVCLEYGDNWCDMLDQNLFMSHLNKEFSIRKAIVKGMKQFIWGVNQPQGNRGYSSPFTNLNIFDYYYFTALFDEYCYPDGTKPTWKQIDTLQRMFIKLLRELRLEQPLTFPVVTLGLLYDKDGYKDEAYEALCADEWAKGSSHFLYHSDSADSLSSCCRVQNKLRENTFSSTTGMVGVMTGSCNVITLNINRIVQDFFKEESRTNLSECAEEFRRYLRAIVERVQKYHIAYKTALYELEENNMITYSTAGWLCLKKLYSTIGSLGYYEAAKFLGLRDGSSEYCEFMDMVHSTIEECNLDNSVYDKKHPFIFNLECVPGENLAIKLYNWDKEDGYVVPEDQELYNSYFFNPWKESDVYTKLEMHGKKVCRSTSGGQACHINLDEHLTQMQYMQIMKNARELGCNNFTFNIPITKCMKCGHIVNGPVETCPKCHSNDVHYFTRVIGFITDVANWAKERRDDFYNRLFGKNRIKRNNA